MSDTEHNSADGNKRGGSRAMYYGGGSRAMYYGGGKRSMYYGGGSPAAYYPGGAGGYGSGYYYGGGGGGISDDEESLMGSVTIGRMIRVCTQRWVTIAVFIILGLVAAFAVYKISPTIYEAESVFEMSIRSATYTGMLCLGSDGKRYFFSQAQVDGRPVSLAREHFPSREDALRGLADIATGARSVPRD